MSFYRMKKYIVTVFETQSKKVISEEERLSKTKKYLSAIYRSRTMFKTPPPEF